MNRGPEPARPGLAAARTRGEAALAAAGWPARLRDLAGDGSNRVYFRAESAERPGFVLMVLAPEAHAEEAGAGAGDDREPFVELTAELAAAGLPVPALFWHDREHGVVALEDLGDVTLAAAWATQGAPPLDLYRQALALLVDFQRHEPPAESLIRGRRYEAAVWQWEWLHFLEYGVEARGGRVVPAAIRARVLEHFAELAADLAAEAPVPVHRDYHSRNLMLHADRLRWIDYQDALLGPPLYDVASLLYDAYVDLPETDRSALLAAYLAEARAAGVSLPETIGPAWSRTAAHRMLKAAGRFIYFRDVKALPGYVAHVPELLRRVAALARTEDADPRLSEVVESLAPWVPEWVSAKNR